MQVAHSPRVHPGVPSPPSLPPSPPPSPPPPSPASAAARPGGIYLLAGGQLHEAADKSRIPDPVQFYIYRHDGAWCSRRSTVTRSPRPSSSNSAASLPLRPLGFPPRAIPSFSRLLSAEVAGKEKQRKRERRRDREEGMPPSKGRRRRRRRRRRGGREGGREREREGGGASTGAAVVPARDCARASERQEVRQGYACCVTRVCSLYVCACSGAGGGEREGRVGSGVYVYVVRHLLRARTSTSCAQLEAPRRGAPRDAHDNIRRRCRRRVIDIARTFNNRLRRRIGRWGIGLIYRGVGPESAKSRETRGYIPRRGFRRFSGKWISRCRASELAVSLGTRAYSSLLALIAQVI